MPEPEPQPDAAATDEDLPEDETITSEDNDAAAEMAQPEKVKPKGQAITVTGASVTKADKARIASKFIAWAEREKRINELSDLLDAEVKDGS